MSKTLSTFSLCFIFLFVLLRQVNAGPNDAVNIPDAALRLVIETKLGKTSGAEIIESEMNGMTGSLTVNYVFVNDLTGLEHATGITEFRVQNNRGEITDLSPLADLTQLTILSIANYKTLDDEPTALSDISAVTKLTNLVELRLDHGIIVDISPLADLTKLTTLTLQRNSIVDTSSLEKLTALTHLDLRSNKLTSLGTAVSKLTALTQLYVNGNYDLSNISAVASLTNLELLHLGSTSITSTGLSAVLPYLSKLKWLFIFYSPISDLSVLGNLPVVLTNTLDLEAMSSDPNADWTYVRGDGQGLGWLLTDLSPLVSLMNAGKVITGATGSVDLKYNWSLDYESLYTHIPALITAGISDVQYTDPVPALERVSAENHVGRPGTSHTFVVRASNTSFGAYKNDRFAKVPITWTVTAPDGTQTETKAVTGDDGLTRISIRLGSHGEMHTAEAVVPANTPANGPTHSELRVSFTATSDKDAPITPDPTLSALTVSFSNYPEARPTDTFSLTIRFSKPVTGFQADDIRVDTELTDGTGIATLDGLTPTTAPTQTYTATVRVPADALGSVRLVVRAGTALTTQGQIGPVRDTASKWIAFERELVGPRDPVPPPVDASVGGGGGGGGGSNLSFAVPPGVQFFIFNEIGNFYDDTNDWIELKNLCNTPLHLSEWEIRFMTTANTETGIEKDVVSFPDFVLPAQAVLLVTNTDPSATRLASGLNIATGARQKGAQHPYFVAPDLKLPETPYLLILQRKVSINGDFVRTIEDMAGNYFWEVSPDSTKIEPYTYTSDKTASTAPLTEFGAWQRRRSEQPGYLAAAWTSIGYRAHIGYDRRTPAALCLGTPGYVRDPSRSQSVTHRLVFNEIRNASDDMNDWIELKNVCGADVQLSDWEISIVLNADQDVDIVSFPDYTLPMDGVLLITNTDPSKTVIANGLNIATGARQKGTQHPYLVAHGLRLPSTPYLLILRHMGEYGERTIEDIAGNYPFTETSSDGNPEIYLLANASRPMEALAPLTQFGAWQRRHLKQPGYLAAAWMSSGYHTHIGYDRHAPASLCLGTPGYHRHDASSILPVTHRLAFNKIHNASDNAANWVDWIELKNVSDIDVRLRDWEISIITSEGEAPDQDVGIVSFPDWTLPVGGVLLIINTDPGEAGIADGLNISTETQQKRTQCPYLVARDLKLPDTPYLLILRHARGKNGTPEAIEDVAGDYFRYDGDTEVWPLAYTRRPSAPAAPLSEAGTYQRKDARQPGYLATAWTAIHPQNYGYDPDAFAALPATRRLAFNKIHNAANHTNDYIELKNISDTEVRLRDWDISMVASEGEAPDQDVSIVSFPDYTLPVGGVLLITNTDPDETVIIDGLNITPDTTEADQQRGAQHPYLVSHDLNLPSAPYLLILRHARGKNGTPEAIEDVAGNYFRIDNNIGVWPFAYTYHPSAPAAPLSETGAYQRKDARQPGYLATAWTVNQSPPGLSDTPNTLEGGENALFAPDAHAAAVIFNPTLPDEVRISELMSETQGPSDALPQWIELYNASPTPVDLEGWQLAIETRTAERHRHARLKLKTFSLPPKQTGILVTGQGKRSSRLPIDRVYDLSKAHSDVFSRYLKNTIIGTDGFFVELIHPTGRVVDTCGNLDGDKATDDLPTWTLPDRKHPQGHRSSLLRRFEGDVRKGTEASGWMPATETAIGVNTYYGHPTDISTPGFLHQIVPGASSRSTLSISEIMFETQIRTRPLPQWIELYNPSFTHSVKLKGYQLLVETRQAGKHQQIVMTLEAFDVLPNQTALLITEQGRHSRHLTNHLIYNLSQRHPRAFLRPPSRSRLLSSDGFLIQLTDDSGNVVDTVGNLDGYPSTEDTPAWAFPPGETSDGERASLRRLYEKQIPLDGRYAKAWMSTADVPPKIITYYGHASDLGNPGYRKGTPLPVTLSGFSAAWRPDTVRITWTTESELDNAGFNILRSQMKEGEFQQINTQLIQGAGTTSERNEYTWTDTTAKPNTVYYYRIEDVSYAGERKQLATVRIRGLVSPNGKLITRWGDVKNQQ